MKILTISQYPLAASTTNRMLGFSIGLTKLGHKVTLLIIGNKYLPGADKKNKLPKTIDNVKIKYTPSLPDSFIVMPGFFNGILAILLLFIIKLPITIYHALFYNIIYFSKPLPYGAIVTIFTSFISRTPFVLDTDDWEGVGGFATIKQGKRALVKGIITYFEEKVPLYAKSVVAASNLLAQRTILSGVHSDAVFIAPNGANLNKFNPKIKRNLIKNKYNLKGTIFCYLGTFKKGGANWQMLLESFYYTTTQISDIMLLVIGFGDQLNEAKNYVIRKNIQDKVIFVGKVDHDNVPKYIAASDICLLPYRDNFPHTFINIGRSSVKLYEYMAMGKAIIGTDIGEVHEALKDGAGILVKTNNSSDFSEAMISLLKKSEAIKRIGMHARKKAENIYNYDKMAIKVEKAIYYAIKK